MEHVFWLVPGRLAGRVGPAAVPWELARLRRAGIQAILNLADDQGDPAEIVAAGFAHCSVPLPPREPADAETERACLARVPRAAAFLDAQLAAGRGVLVHCSGGKDRTGMVLAHYLAREEGLDAEAAVARLRVVRPIALSAPGWEAMTVRVIRSLLAADAGRTRARARFSRETL